MQEFRSRSLRMRLAVSICSLVLLLSSRLASAVELLSPEAFTQRCADSVIAKVPSVTIDASTPLRLAVDHPKSGASKIYLEEAYETYEQAPEKIDEIIQQYASGALEALPAGDGIDPSRIVPIIRPRSWLAEIGVLPGSSQPPVVYDNLNAELVVVYAENTPNSLSFFSPSELKSAEVDPGGLRQLAATNLVRILPKIERRGEDGVYMVVAGGEFETSLLAIGSGWRKNSFDVKGDFVFAAPARGSLYVTGSDDEAGIKTLRGYARTAYRDSSQKISPNLFVQRDGRLIVLPE